MLFGSVWGEKVAARCRRNLTAWGDFYLARVVCLRRLARESCELLRVGAIVPMGLSNVPVIQREWTVVADVPASAGELV